MGLEDIKPGKYKAVAIGGKFGESPKNKTPGVGIEFAFELEDGSVENMKWTGWLSEKAIERTFKTLALVGYDESKGNLPDGTIPREYFDPKAAVEIEIAEEEENYIDAQGTPKSVVKKKIKWVNRLGGGGFQVSESTNVSQMLKGLGGLKAHMASARADLGIGKTTVAKPAAVKQKIEKKTTTPDIQADENGEPTGFDNSEELPF